MDENSQTKNSFLAEFDPQSMIDTPPKLTAKEEIEAETIRKEGKCTTMFFSMLGPRVENHISHRLFNVNSRELEEPTSAHRKEKTRHVCR